MKREMNIQMEPRTQRIISVICFSAVILFTCASFYFEYNNYHANDPRVCDFYCCDFHMRMNEAQCVREGIDPFDVWSGKIAKMPYVPNNRHDLWTSERNEFINAYTPWSYPLVIPLTFLPRTVAWRVYYTFMILCVVALGYMGFLLGWREFGSVCAGMLVSTFALSIPYAMNYNLLAGNYCILITVAIVGMAMALKNGKDSLAGILWAIAMIKPQMAIYLAIPLLLKRKFFVCFVAAAICLFLLGISSYLCGASPLKLICEATEGSSFWFKGSGLVPYDFLMNLERHGVSKDAIIAVSGMIGVGVCVVVTWIVRNASDWFVLFVPATICAVTCNYANGYNFCVCSVFLIAMASSILSSRRPLITFVGCLLPILSAIRLYDCFAYVIGQKAESLRSIGLWRWGDIPAEFNLSANTWCSTLLLLCALAYCFWYNIHYKAFKAISSRR